MVTMHEIGEVGVAAGELLNLHGSFEIRNVCEHVISNEKVCATTVGNQIPRCLQSEESDDGRNTFFLRMFCNVRSRFNSKNGNSLVLEKLQEVTIVARDLNDLALATKSETAAYCLRIGFAVREPTI